MKLHVLSLLVSNHFGVLTRVTNLFGRRGFNIRELTVGETRDKSLSRITILTEGDEHTIEQIKRQLAKLEDVKAVKVLPQNSTVCRELLLIKVKLDDADTDSLIEEVTAMGGRVLSIFGGAAIVEYTGGIDEVEHFMEKMEGCTEVCRTGITALQKGNTTLNQNGQDFSRAM